MDVRLSPEQIALRDSVGRVVADLAPRAVGELADTDRVAALDRVIRDAGWRELRAPASTTGEPWASSVEVAVVAEELAKGPADGAFIGPTIAAELRRLTGAPPAEAAETVLLTSCLGRLAFDGPHLLAIDAAGSSTALAIARSDDGWILTATPLAPTGAPVDLTRPSAIPAGPARPVPGQQRALTDDDLERVHALGRSIAAADLVGTMDGAVQLAIGYVTERRQYGRPVGSFQAVQHLLADAFVFTEGSRSAALHAAWAVDALPPADAMSAASVAKAYAGRSARTVCETVIQVHGGIGNTWECRAHLYLRRALLSIELFGGIQASLTSVLAHHGIEVR